MSSDKTPMCKDFQSPCSLSSVKKPGRGIVSVDKTPTSRYVENSTPRFSVPHEDSSGIMTSLVTRCSK